MTPCTVLSEGISYPLQPDRVKLTQQAPTHAAILIPQMHVSSKVERLC